MLKLFFQSGREKERRRRRRRRREKRLGCGRSGNDRFEFKPVFTDAAESIHTHKHTDT